MVEDKYVGLALAILSTMAIGTSFVITKKGLLEASERHGFEGEGFAYLKSPTWWGGIVTMVLGEVANFAAYAFAPAILVTPLGALSVLIGAVLGSYFLKEDLGTLGKLGCALCLIGSVIIVLHAPPDKEIQTVDEILQYAIHPGTVFLHSVHSWGLTVSVAAGFLLYCAAVAIFSSVMIYKVAPKHGKKNPLIFISICSTVGSVSVMSVKAFGIALKLTLNGKNQLTHPSTYAFAIVTVCCILTQMNYFNKALSQFSTSMWVLPGTLKENTLMGSKSQSAILCYVHNFHISCLFHPLPGFQYNRRSEYSVSIERILGYLYRGLPAKSITRRS